jgi:membrane protease YdiL (CAAX protease family)
MRAVAAGLLLLCLGALWYFVRDDIAEYAAFKRLTETMDRQRRYRVWVLKSFLLFSGATIVGLLILGRLHALATLPAEFRPFSESIRSLLGDGQLLRSGGFLAGFGAALLTGLIAGAVAVKLRFGRFKPCVAADIEPLMPRNGPEIAHAALLAVNAGLSEELFFRLLIPLLLTLLLGNAAAGFVIATTVFGAIHVYQGLVGVATTTILGGLLAGLYLWTGNLWIAVAMHALLDVLGLVVRPSIARLFAA